MAAAAEQGVMEEDPHAILSVNEKEALAIKWR
jgi:hypothetical protein